MADLLPWLADALVLLGLAVITAAVVGMLWMPDLLLRLHAASKSAVLGAAPVLVGASLAEGPGTLAQAALVVALLLVTTPVATHAIARAASVRGHTDPPSDQGSR